MKKVYIAHPLRGDVEGNMKKVQGIVIDIMREGLVIPFSPLHAFSFYDSSGPQELVMKYCYALLASCDELWVYGGYQHSEGCLLEIKYAMLNHMPIVYF